jgi:UDP-N-acetylglucosamine--N-acetylmuramyl-(pentapeptide) pyrophosphoryl-undecaprenol N-acetylglucosamine transferase
MRIIDKKKIIISTGGTGGHVFPAYSLAKNFIKEDYSVEIITDKRGLKYLNKHNNIKLTINNSATIFKKNIINLFFSTFIILFSYLKSLVILYKAKPIVVFGMGGYASFPICIAARTLSIPFIIYENNLQIGKSNKYLLPFASKIFISYQDIIGIKNKYDHKVVVTGNII